MEYVTLAMHTKKDYPPDTIFSSSQRAKRKEAELGRDAVINATLGECLKEDGSPYFLPTVIATLQSLPGSEFSSYAPIAGIPGYREAVIKAVFGSSPPSHAFIETVATPGGTGALRLAVWNFLDAGEAALTTDWHWPAYKGICEEHKRKLAKFSMFDSRGHFFTEEMEKQMQQLLSSQKNLLLILNTPAHNPTGYSMSEQEMAEVFTALEKTANAYPDKHLTLLLDASYLEHAGNFTSSRAPFKAIRPLPKNAAVLLLYSMTKSFMLSGIRLGALVCLAQSRQAADAYLAALSYSARGTWGNAVRCAQTTLAALMDSPTLQAQTEKEREEIKAMLQKRSHIFLEAAEKADLLCCPYHNGFFISIPCKKPGETAAFLETRHTFLIPLANGLRFSPCAVPLEGCKKAPALIKEAISRLES